MPTVIEIVRAELVRLGADGLVCPPAECACKADELAPCDGHISECEPGWLVPAAPGESEHDWTMHTSKEAADAARSNR